MADNLNDFDLRTRANLAYLWSGALIIFVGFTLYMYGHILAVLTLIVGFITGTAATILAVYFGSAIAAKKPDNSAGPISGDNMTVNVTPTADVPPANPPATI